MPFFQCPFDTVRFLTTRNGHKSLLKELGHAVLGNFSTNQIAIKLTKLSKEWLKTIEELKQNTGKPRRDMD